MKLPTALLALALALPATHAWSCDSVTLDSTTYDLSPLKGTVTASKRSDTPPTISEARARFDICGEVAREGDDEDQCPTGTKACLTLINHKPSASPPERVTSVIPMWTGEDPEVTKAEGDGGGLVLKLKAGDWGGSPQTMEILLKCAETQSEPELDSYTAGTLKLQWATPASCAPGTTPPPNDKDGNSDGETPSDPSSSGWGFFGVLSFLFWTAFFLLVAYFAIGIAYNHQQYSARGWDLVPHRDFWRELPALLRDLAGHFVANVRQSTGRGGYSSLG